MHVYRLYLPLCNAPYFGEKGAEGGGPRRAQLAGGNGVGGGVCGACRGVYPFYRRCRRVESGLGAQRVVLGRPVWRLGDERRRPAASSDGGDSVGRRGCRGERPAGPGCVALVCEAS